MTVRRLSWIGVAGLLALQAHLFSQDGSFNICVRASFTTSARIYHYPESADPVLRGFYATLNGLTSYGAEIRYRLPSTNVELSLGTEYLTTTRKGLFSLIQGSEAFLLPIDEGFTLVPIETSALIVLPFGGQRVKIRMGGGTGFYLGWRKFQLADVDAPTQKTAFNFGIHVLTGLDYLLTDNLALRGEIKFRDPQYDVGNRYSKTTVRYGNAVLPLDQSTFTSRINIDGIAFTFGIAYYF